MLSKFMPLSGTFITYNTHLSLSSCCIEDWAFSEKSIYFLAIYFPTIYFSVNHKPKNTKLLHLLLFYLLNLLTNTFSSLWVPQPFLYGFSILVPLVA